MVVQEDTSVWLRTPVVNIYYFLILIYSLLVGRMFITNFGAQAINMIGNNEVI
eukprot:UN33356